MNHLYELYKKLKQKNSMEIYLFKTGIFYIFLEDDAKFIEQYIPLKLTNYTKNTVKCGFPSNAKSKYLKILKLYNFKITIIDVQNFDEVLAALITLDLDNLPPIEALNQLKEIKDLISNE